MYQSYFLINYYPPEFGIINYPNLIHTHFDELRETIVLFEEILWLSFDDNVASRVPLIKDGAIAFAER